jgi:RNA polymerase subunit RPABC4/transcription elongation factor Spt4
MNLDPALLKQITLFATGFSAAFLAALWLALIFWTARDIRKRSRDRFMRILAVIVVALLFLPGVLVYLILRPPRSLEEEYQRSLEEEALLQTIEDAPLCPGCSRKVQKDWIACPSCHLTLKKTCTHCGKVIDLPWNLCPYCATPVPGMRVETLEESGFEPFPPEEKPGQDTNSDDELTPYS